MTGKARFLLITGSPNSYWQSILSDALIPLGTLEATSEKDAVELVLRNTYDLIIVDATTVSGTPTLVTQMRSRRWDSRIVVATDLPTWTRAREAFQAGATDYIRKFLDKEELLAVLRIALAKVLPPWSRPQNPKERTS